MKEYKAWHNMKQRCLKLDHPKYKHYGARGIKVCDRWLLFDNFLSDMGNAPKGLTLERINNDSNYEPGNCKWATWEEQNKNKRPRGTVTKHVKYSQSPKMPLKRIGIIRHLYHSQGWSFNKISKTFGIQWGAVKKYAVEYKYEK